MNNLDTIGSFSVSLYGNLEQYNQVLSKARCRIFYKRLNRNGTYITDEFAEKLLSTIPYTPIKGIYSDSNEDYTDHGKARDLGRIYGIVPENPNIAWEKHLDEDGVEREYACVDVLLFTAIYKEANEILDKAQSMELHLPSIKGTFQFVQGRKAFVYEDACFLGLQVLGEDVEPCFEGAAFFTFYDSLKEMINKLEEYKLKENQGGTQMTVTFKLSDSQKYDMIFSLLNPEFNEEGHWTITYGICEVYDEYAIARNYETGEYERVYYTKDDAEDSVSINKTEVCYIIDVNEKEKQSLETIRSLNSGTYEKLEENFVAADSFDEEKAQYEQKITENETSIATLEQEVANHQATIAQLNSDLQTLEEYKLNIESEQKQQIIEKYSGQLDEDVISAYSEKIGEYTIDGLEKELAFELVQSTPSIFTQQEPQRRIPVDDHKSGVDAILEKYKK